MNGLGQDFCKIFRKTLFVRFLSKLKVTFLNMSLWISFENKTSKKTYFLELSPSDKVGDAVKILQDIYHLPASITLTHRTQITHMEKTFEELGIQNYAQIILTMAESANSINDSCVAPSSEEEIQKAKEEKELYEKKEAEAKAKDPPNFEELVRNLEGQGFGDAEVRQVLRENHYDVNLAYEILNSLKSAETENVHPTTTSTTQSVLLSTQQTSTGLRVSGQEYHNIMQDNYNKLTDAEKQAIQNIVSAGFSQSQAVEAYLACEKNEQNALNFLVSG